MSQQKKLLFVCTANQQRSPTAEALFSHHHYYQARSCGIDSLSRTVCNDSLIEWADLIFCMEEMHRQVLLEEYSSARSKEIIVLDIPDVYSRHDPRLINQLRSRLKLYLEYPLDET